MISRYEPNKAANCLKPPSEEQREQPAKPLPTGLRVLSPSRIGSITHTFGEQQIEALRMIKSLSAFLFVYLLIDIDHAANMNMMKKLY